MDGSGAGIGAVSIGKGLRIRPDFQEVTRVCCCVVIIFVKASEYGIGRGATNHHGAPIPKITSTRERAELNRKVRGSISAKIICCIVQDDISTGNIHIGIGIHIKYSRSPLPPCQRSRKTTPIRVVDMSS